jgi:ring-1,2-phenylacetyl-CoA epoxidase subunit PaaD
VVGSLPTESQVYEWLASVPDPEIPVLSILDLGIVRGVTVDDEKDKVTVTLTPTYSGCPATEVIETSVVLALREQGVDEIQIERVLAPPWTTDWITDDGRQKLRDYGIAPPSRQNDVDCPQCESSNTERISEFGSTACKASWRCLDCREPFEYFKCL